jgi:exonuclease VII large subunit
MLTKEISKVEKEIVTWKEARFKYKSTTEDRHKAEIRLDELMEKLSTLKSAQAKALELEDSLRANKNYIKLLQDKLDNAQAKFDKFVDKIINHIDLRNQQLIDNDEGVSTDNMLKTIIYQEMKVFIKELSSKQEGTC